MTWLLVVLVVLATARLTRLINEDAILDAPRAWVQQHAPDSVVYLVQCPWCVSMWVGGPVAAAAVLWPSNRAVAWGLLALAASEVTGLIAARETP